MGKSNKLRHKMAWRRHNIDHIPPHIKGVYAFWCRVTRKCIYVGKTKEQSIKVRLLQHWCDTGNHNRTLWIRAFGKSLDICYLPVKYGKIDKMEKRLIHAWHPETNILDQLR